MKVFPTGKDLQVHLDDYLEHHNKRRPHSAFGRLTPAAHKDKIKIKMEAEALTP